MSIVTNDSIEIREVWNDNLEEEIARIEQFVDDFPYVAMDTEFPGTVCKPVSENPNLNPRGYDFNPRNHELNYESIRTNVNMLKLIQLGLTLSDEQGNLPTCGTNKQCVWQFNFREFNVSTDLCAMDSINLLRESGINFTKNNQCGVEAKRFAELLTASGVVLNDNIRWVTFHCGYDFGYLLKLLTGKDLPEKQSDFLTLVNTFFPRVYDIKYMVDFCGGLYGGLNKVAELLHIERVGVSHQAGSDSLLTLHVFMKIKMNYFPGSSMDKHSGFLYGLGDVNSQLLLTEKKKEK